MHPHTGRPDSLELLLERKYDATATVRSIMETYQNDRCSVERRLSAYIRTEGGHFENIT